MTDQLSPVSQDCYLFGDDRLLVLLQVFVAFAALSVNTCSIILDH